MPCAHDAALCSAMPTHVSEKRRFDYWQLTHSPPLFRAATSTTTFTDALDGWRLQQCHVYLPRLLCVFHGIGVVMCWRHLVKRAVPMVICLFAGVPPLCTAVVWGCAGGGRPMASLG
ncbi:hypothetical protein Tc00.1047053510783.20 [Trypanosoma cruzi]|uniref:Uncharacterized protein n=1 Tax=Trypanosoma cruzi (strain CL Brener) TaxID=353153 RepID=Q4CZ49_TRYCC|nr:hypothetical protein Tc00.1047053510783.20 [Trypanosoma cruzi]EAN85550.1 hypothetical protein Tc00.1047053510783.20 [Trypanosoma cruzi]|eukprot:XP_807401.1 hypothetical protein [Trypanosoma cruzi strain CL Brener]